MKPGTHSEQDKKWSLWMKPGTPRTSKPGNTPGRLPVVPGPAYKPWRRTGPSLPKTVRHPTDAAEKWPFSDNRCSGKRPMLKSSPAPLFGSPSCGSHIGHDGPSCLQDPRGAIRHRDQPPKQNENPVRHSLNLAHPLVLAVSSRTRRILAIHYAPAFPADCLKHLSLLMFSFPCGKRTQTLFYPMHGKLQPETTSSGKAIASKALASHHCHWAGSQL